MLVKIIEMDGRMQAINTSGDLIPFNKPGKDHPTLWKNTATKAFQEGYAFELVDDKWSKISVREFDKAEIKANAPVDVPDSQLELMNFIQASPELRPEVMKMSDIKWKNLIRCCLL